MSKDFCWKLVCRWACAGAMAVLSSAALSQMPEQTVQTDAQQGGSSTAGAFAPVLDSEKRPITEGGFVKKGPIVFEDVSAKAGLTSWHHTMGTAQKKYIIEETGSGVALLDYDHDGWLDIYLVNGSTYDAQTGKTTPPHLLSFITITMAPSRMLRTRRA